MASATAALAEARVTISGMLPPDASLSTVVGTPIAQQPPIPTQALLTRSTSTRAELRALQQLGNARRSKPTRLDGHGCPPRTCSEVLNERTTFLDARQAACSA